MEKFRPNGEKKWNFVNLKWAKKEQVISWLYFVKCLFDVKFAFTYQANLIFEIFFLNDVKNNLKTSFKRLENSNIGML